MVPSAQWNLNSVDVRSCEGLGQLKCPHLQQLSITNSVVRLGRSTFEHIIGPGVLDCCTEITKLCLSSCILQDGPGSLGLLTSLRQLRHMQLHQTVACGDVLLDFPSTLLQQLPHLTQLTLDSELQYQSDSMQHLSCLTALQELTISEPDTWRMAHLKPLSFSPSTAPGLSTLTALRSLRLSCFWTLDPTVLFACTGLHHLELEQLRISTAGDQTPLLALVGKLPKLQVLSLANMGYQWPAPASCSKVGYTALTASSCLQRMEVKTCHMPDGLWQAVFPASGPVRQLSALTALVAPYGQGIYMREADVQQVVRWCPSLQELDVCLVGKMDLGVLQELPHLTSLVLNRLDPFTWRSLKAVTRLRALSFSSMVHIHIPDLMLLTALRQLTSLQMFEVRWWDPRTTYDEDGFEEGYDEERGEVNLQHKDPASPPEVWAQLLQLCATKLQAAWWEEQRQRWEVEQQLQEEQRQRRRLEQRLQALENLGAQTTE